MAVQVHENLRGASELVRAREKEHERIFSRERGGDFIMWSRTVTEKGGNRWIEVIDDAITRMFFETDALEVLSIRSGEKHELYICTISGKEYVFEYSDIDEARKYLNKLMKD